MYVHVKVKVKLHFRAILFESNSIIGIGITDVVLKMLNKK